MTTTFVLPREAEATAPPEWQGLERDEVRLLAVRPDGLTHGRARDLPDLLEPGDLVVVNTSATLPARVSARRADGVAVPLHVSTSLDDGSWVVEVRRPDNDGPDLRAEPGTVLALPGGVRLTLLAGFPDPSRASRLWRAAPEPAVATTAYLPVHGQPIRYGYLHGSFPLAAYQNVYATEPGSAEMASAGRPLTERLIVALVARGHPGRPGGAAHRRLEPRAARAAVSGAVRRPGGHGPTGHLDRVGPGGRVVAVGTTVTRALETATDDDGVVRPRSGWTDLVLGPDRPARTVTGLLTGLHAPEASHLQLLEAVAGRALVDEAYRAAVAEHYLWHEFGDAMLFLP